MNPCSVKRPIVAAAAAMSLLAAMFMTAPPASAETIWFCDINGDRFDDLFVGAPREDLRRSADAGVAHEFLSNGRSFDAWATWSAGRQQGQRFGESLICADFDDDGFDDVVVGRPWVDRRGARDYGRIDVLYGGPDGAGARIETISKDLRGMPGGRSGPDEFFGWDMTYGDFDDDGIEDLAVGMPGTTVRGAANAGGVYVIPGSRRGLAPGRASFFTQNTTTSGDRAERDDFFGEYLTAADVDGDFIVDLVVGVPAEDIGSARGAGAVEILFGSAAGITGRSALIHRGTPGVSGRVTAGELWGAPLFFGNFSQESGGTPNPFEMVIGVPGQDVRGATDAGAVQIIGLDVAGRVRTSQIITAASPGITGGPTRNAQFGRSVITNDFNGDGLVDLAVGEPGASIRGNAAAGALHVVFGDGQRLSRQSRRITFDRMRGGEFQAGAFFGGALASGDFDSDGYADLAIGSPFADWRRPRARDGGVVSVAYGSPNGVTGRRSVLLGQAAFGRQDPAFPAEDCDNFGLFNPQLRLPVPSTVRAQACILRDRASDLVVPDHAHRRLASGVAVDAAVEPHTLGRLGLVID